MEWLCKLQLEDDIELIQIGYELEKRFGNGN